VIASGEDRNRPACSLRRSCRLRRLSRPDEGCAGRRSAEIPPGGDKDVFLTVGGDRLGGEAAVQSVQLRPATVR
jgi:hypothetical protein